MNNTHKLLLAFIDASGYEVEEVETRQPFKQGDIDGYHSIIDYKVTEKEDMYITCMGCLTRLSVHAPLDSCQCGKPDFLVRHKDKDAYQ